MDPEQLFVEAFEDLQARVGERTLYAAVRCSAILRQLFLDQHTLLAQANASVRLKLVFTALGPARIDWAASGLPRPQVEFLGEQLAGTPPPLVRTNLTLDQFLAYRVVRVGDREFSARELIKFIANVRGGVHLGVPDDDQRVLDGLDELFRREPLRLLHEEIVPTVLTLRGIAQITLEGIRPLYEALLDKYKPSRRSFTVLGYRNEIPIGFPGVQGALLANLIADPVDLGPFRAVPPTQFTSWAQKPPELDQLQPLALALGYGAYKRFAPPELAEIPCELDGVYRVPTSVSSGQLPRAIVWRRDDARRQTALLRMTQDTEDIMALWWDADNRTLNFRLRDLCVALDCSWARGLYAVSYCRWEPGRISLTYGTCSENGEYSQRTAITR